MDVNSSWGRWEIKRGELQANPLPQGGSGFHRGHDGPLIFFLGPLSLAPPSSWGSSSSLILEFLSLTIPFLSRVSNLPTSPCLSYVLHLHLQSCPHPHNPRNLKPPCNHQPFAFSSQSVPTPPKGWSVDRQHQHRVGAHLTRSSHAHPDLPNQNPCVHVAGVGQGVEGSQDLRCNTHHR